MSKGFDKTVLCLKYTVWVFASQNRQQQQHVQIEHYDDITGEFQSIESNPLTTNCSIPQGRVIGCLLFLIYINEIPKVCKPLCVFFADNVSILID